jgi:two-component system, NtrC family, response regulator HydG
MPMKKILVIDDDVDICLLLSKFLTRNGYEVSTTYTGGKALDSLKKGEKYDLVFSDFRLGDMDGLEVLTKIKEMNPALPVIIITGYSDIKVAVKVIKMGAFDYVTKPLLPEEILHTIKKALEPVETGKGLLIGGGGSPRINALSTSSDALLSDNYIIGESAQAKELYKQIDLVAPTNYSVIILGESGTGKESVAQTIHNRSARKDKPFIAMDCGSLSKELAGSELFGHEKGAFTGALFSKAGHFEIANGGTIFLDEVANLSYEIQVSLLRVVQERKVKRIGGTKEVSLDVRIIVASNENLSEAFQKGKFREDLYHRFNEFIITIPPLRDRQDDIMVFANHFLSVANRELNKNIKGFSDDVVNSFMTYQWPGNLRELKNVIKRAALLTNGDLVMSKALPGEISYNTRISFSENSISGIPSLHNNHTNGLSNHNSIPQAPNLKNIALEAEYETIINVLKQVNFNKTKAAKILNIDRKTLYNKMKVFNL